MEGMVREREVRGYTEIVIRTLSKIPRASNSFYPTTNGRLPAGK